MYRSILLILGVAICAIALGSEDDLIRDQWRVAGHDVANSRSQPAEMLIGPHNVQSLAVKWVFTTGGDVSATPTVFAVNKNTGQLIWSGSAPTTALT